MAALPREPLWAGVLLGIGFGGLLDIALFHMVLQWHHLASDRPDLAQDLAANLRLDGWLATGAWATAAIGFWGLLHRASQGAVAPRRVLGGGLLGWAAFNLLDLLVNHVLLGLHTVHPSGDPAHELGVAVASLAVAGLSLWLLRRNG